MLASSPGPCAAARSRGGRERPPYNTRQTGGGTGNGRPPLLCCRPPTGALWGGRFRPPQTRLPPQTSPAGVNARREDLRHPGRVLARQGAAPLRRLGRHLPLQGRLYRRQSPQSLPCKGRWMRRKAQTEGCIAGLRQKYPARPGRTLPCLRRGRCLHRPGNPAVAQGPRGGRNRPPYIAAGSGQQRTNASRPSGPPEGRCKHRPLRRGAASAGRAAACRSQSRRPYALHCRAGVHARRGGLGRGDAVVLRKRRTARPGRAAANREGIGKGWERHPQAAADKPSAVTPAGSKFRW